MKQNLAKTVMIVTGLGILVGVVVAQEVPNRKAGQNTQLPQTPDYGDESTNGGFGGKLPSGFPGANRLGPSNMSQQDAGLFTGGLGPNPGASGQPNRWLRFGPANARGDGTLAQEAEQVARSIGTAKSDAEKDKLKSRLSEILEKQFDVRQRRHESEIAELEAQVRKLRELVQKRQENRREIIAKRLDMIVRDAEGLGW
jgi:hypothetical protein